MNYLSLFNHCELCIYLCLTTVNYICLFSELAPLLNLISLVCLPMSLVGLLLSLLTFTIIPGLRYIHPIFYMSSILYTYLVFYTFVHKYMLRKRFLFFNQHFLSIPQFTCSLENRFQETHGIILIIRCTPPKDFIF